VAPQAGEGPGAILVARRGEGYDGRFAIWEFFAMRHVLSAVVQNVPGVLAHVSGMLASRGYNIDSLAVGETEEPNLSRMTFVVVGDDRVLDQVRKQLEKIVTVVQVDDVSSRDHVERDLMLLKVEAPPGNKRTEIRELVEIFRAQIVDVGEAELMIEISGRESKIEAFIQRMRPYGILELVRTGRIAMVRGKTRQPKTEEEAEEQDQQERKLVG
jgi:acetolactate synthase-1/3 small subunit